MKRTLLAYLAVASTALAFPPAPDHTLQGVIRDEGGRPLDFAEGTIILSGPSGEIVRSQSDTNFLNGLNYSLHVPIDNGTNGTLYQINALRPAMPFTIRVIIRSVSYLPIQMQGKTWNIGQAAGVTRLDLTLGVDSDGDGIPDSWEQGLIDNDTTGTLFGLADVKPGEDLDKDGLTNLQEYLIGTYALDKAEGLALDILEVKDGHAKLEFVAVTGRNYRIQQSSTLGNWQNAQVKTSPTAPAKASFRAGETGMLSLHVPIDATASKMQYRLVVE